MTNLLLPMAGAGTRFIKEGYEDSKPLIDVNGLPMIVRVLDNLPAFDNYIFIVRKDTHDIIRLKNLLMSLKPQAKIIEVEKLTRGAAETCLLAEPFINNDDPLLIANCDQIQIWDTSHFANYCLSGTSDGVIATFKSSSNAFSYVAVDEHNKATRCAEKVVISENATTGIYFWRTGSSFIRCAKQMISKNIRTNNEFYVCPVYNELIQEGGNVSVYPIKEHWSIGTPEELRKYISHANR